MTAQLVPGLLAALLLAAADPLSLLTPPIRLSSAERRDLNEGRTVARTLDADGDQVGVAAISRIELPPNSLIERTRAIEQLKRSSFVLGVGVFSDPPQPADLDGLVLTARDVAAAAACGVGNCSFKLTAPEIALLHSSASAEGGDRDNAYQRGFRRVVLARVNAYLAEGITALPPVVNRRSPLLLSQVHNRLVAATAIPAGMPVASEWLQTDPSRAEGVESLLYWSYETYGAGKPVVSVAHVGLFPSREDHQPALVIARQIFASRYMTGSVALTAVTGDADGTGHHLVYVNRTGVDLLGGVFGSIKRAVLESRLKRDVPGIVAKLRTRLERDGTAR
jgi:hypothetical protein